MSPGERWLVTGALGCIGAWTCTLLAREGVRVTGFDLGEDDARLRLIASKDERACIALERGDITDLDAVERAVSQATHVVHLAALQVPFCREDPPLGARVNVTGTVDVFEAAKRHGLSTTLAYASSAAVYDEQGEIAPRTIYGVYKVANEGTARIYFQDHRVASIGIRPFTVYGPGRDQGVTAAPTLAMQAAARGEPYRIGFGGRTQMHYAPDVAAAFIAAARTPPTAAAVYNLGGEAVALAEVARMIGPDVEVDEQPLPFPEQLPQPWFDVPLTPLADGIAQTIETYRAAAVLS
jgi:nucleoside-diphosphate-sugar epimerase